MLFRDLGWCSVRPMSDERTHPEQSPNPLATQSERLVFLDALTMACEGDLDLSVLEEFGALELHQTTAPVDTAERVQGAGIVLTNKVVLGPKEMDAAGESLKLIVVCATGTNNIDLKAAEEREIAVCNVSGYSTPGVAQHVFALVLNLMTHVGRYGAEARQWAQSPMFTRLDYPVLELSGRMLGIVGFGAIGAEVAAIAKAFGMSVQALESRGGGGSSDVSRVPLRKLFETSDIVSLHCPLTPETENMINTESLSWMKPDSILINTGRGALVDEVALLEALKNGSLGGAGLDVLTAEPPPADHPLLQAELPNLLITPHTAWSSVESRRRLLDGVLADIRAFQNGERLNRVV